METTEKKRRAAKHRAIEPRTAGSTSTTLTMLVNREWSDEVSRKAREKNMTKTAYIISIVDGVMKSVDNNEANKQILDKVNAINDKVDTLTNLYTSLLNIVSKMK